MCFNNVTGTEYFQFSCYTFVLSHDNINECGFTIGDLSCKCHSSVLVRLILIRLVAYEERATAASISVELSSCI